MAFATDHFRQFLNIEEGIDEEVDHDSKGSDRPD
jgi:hypothetical protein